MSYRIIVHKRAGAYLQRLPTGQKDHIKTAIRQLGTDPANVAHSMPMLGE